MWGEGARGSAGGVVYFCVNVRMLCMGSGIFLCGCEDVVHGAAICGRWG